MVERPVLVSFYFDCACPWSYLAMGRLREAALRTGARVDWRPVFSAAVLEAANPGYPADRQDPNPRKARYQAKDLQDWARYLGLRIQRPERWPVRAELAQRAAVAAAAAGRAGPFLEALFGAYFGEGRDIEDRAVILSAAAEAGLDGAVVAAALEDPATLAAVEANGAALVELGGFGVPSMVVGDDLFFGNDRMPLVEAALIRAADIRLVLPGQHGA
jgi:2-hydroxychromene-2-carboxylate isomerase